MAEGHEEELILLNHLQISLAILFKILGNTLDRAGAERTHNCMTWKLGT